MQKSGTITNIAPDGGYQSQSHGYIHTYQITIQCQDGIFTGQIGAKSETYPLGVGSPITVEMTQTQHGVRFKKINPQYAQGQQGPSQAAGQPNGPKRDYDAENRGKCRTQFIKAAIIGGGLRCTSREDVIALTEFAMTGNIPTAKPEYQPNPEFQENPSEPPEDDIPF